MAANEVSFTKPCPNCGAEMSAYRHFVTWCPACNYGIEGEQKEEKKKNRLEKLYDELGKQQSLAIFENIRKDATLQPIWTKTRILIYFLASLVHLISLLLLITGLVLLVVGWNNFIALCLGALLLGLAWILRPQPIPAPKENVLTRQEFPALYELVDRIGQILGTRVDQIVVDEGYNASFSQTGWKQKKTLAVGLPLWNVLSDQERIAIIGHEMAHAVNGDASRSFFVSTAIQSLRTWYIVLVPDSIEGSEPDSMNVLQIPFKLLAAGLVSLIWAFIRLMTILLFRDMQRAEYLADRLGADVSGCEAFISSLRKTAFADTFMLAVQHCALNSQKTDIYKEFQELMERTPASELERIRRMEERNMTKLDTTHPPTNLRIKMLEEHGIQAPKIVADSETMQTIDQQFKKHRVKIQAKLINNYQAAIYY